MKSLKDLKLAIPRVTWIVAADDHERVAAELEWLATYSLESLMRSSGEAPADRDADSAFDNAAADGLWRAVSARRWAEEQVESEASNTEPLSPYASELLCLMSALHRLATKHRGAADICTQLAKKTKRGRPVKRVLERENGLPAAKPGRKLLVPIPDEQLLAIVEIGRHLFDATTREMTEHVARHQLKKQGMHSVGARFQSRVRNLQRRVSEVRAKVRKQKP